VGHAGSDPPEASPGVEVGAKDVESSVSGPCKGRGFCPSCGGRRMTEHAGQLVETVLPRVPVRQWVLTLPYRLRYRSRGTTG
jgi:hypothetical protein